VRKLGFRSQLLLGAVLPALVMVALLEYVFLLRYQRDIETTFFERGRAVVHQLGVATEFALFTGSFATINLLAAGVRQSEKDIVAVHVFDRAGYRIAGDGTTVPKLLPLGDELQVSSDTSHVIIQGPIRQAALALDAGPWGAPATATELSVSGGVIGYITVEISRDDLKQRRDEMLRITVMILFGGLLFAGWISMRIAHDVMSRLEQAQRALQQEKEKAELLACTDALTGLANRRAFDEAMQHEMRRAERYGTPLALVIADLDYFKTINDRFGHHVGDQVIKDFSQTLRSAVRDIDLVGRWGGEEFVVLMPGTTLAEAQQAAERMRLAAASQPTRAGDTCCGYTASFGVAALSPTVHNLMGVADAALYRAKENGRNRVEAGA
jgi:diguanylate cyclase (GGDEF)-like protein